MMLRGASTRARGASGHGSHTSVPLVQCRAVTRPCRSALKPVCYSLSTADVIATIAERETQLLMPLPMNVESPADDATLHNPLQRMERLSTGWFGVIMEYEGVIVETSDETHKQAWLKVAEEFGYQRPIGQLFRRIKGVPDEVIVSRLFNWSRNPTIVKQVAQRKAAIYEQLLGGRQPAAMLEARPFLETLKTYSIPVALASPLPERKVQEGLKRFNLQPYFNAIVTAEDSGPAEPEYYLAYAAQQIQRPPLRCVVVGESTTSVEAAHELGMKSVVISGNRPVYDFVGADLVVRNLSQLSFINLKRLLSQEELVQARMQEEEQRSDTSDVFDDGSFASFGDYQ